MNSGERERVERRLAAILAADVAGYARLMGADEEGTLQRLTACRAIVDALIATHRGRIFHTAGDSVVADFASAVDAVQCAVAVQEALAVENLSQPSGRQMQFRIGVHVGDVIVQGDNLLGESVNIAARLEGLADLGGICVSGAVHDQIGTKLAVSFTELGEQVLKNINRPVRVFRIRSTLTHPDANAPGSPLSRNAGEGAERQRREAGEGILPPAPPLPDKPSIAVLPFANMSGDPEQEYFVDGMVEEIITALSRIRWLFVIARNSSFTYKGQAVDVKQVGRELGVRYVLEGSVRKSGNRVRITGQLIDAATGAHLWADRFDGSLEDVFDLQDKVASSVAGVIEPALQAAETALSAGRPTEDLTAYDLYLRAYAMFWSSAQVHEALRLLEQAIARDPGYGPALAWAAQCCFRLILDGRSEDPAADRLKGADYARRALEVARDDPRVLAEAAEPLAHSGEDIGAVIALADRALVLNPSFARGWHISGVLRLFAGQPEIAIEHVETALRLSPRARVGSSFLLLGMAHFASRRFDKAAAKLLLAIQENPSFAQPYRVLAACYAHMGRLDDARDIVTRLRAITSVVIPDASFLRKAEHRELFLSGLRLAAGEPA